jgi:hypothetical protein
VQDEPAIVNHNFSMADRIVSRHGSIFAGFRDSQATNLPGGVIQEVEPFTGLKFMEFDTSKKLAEELPSLNFEVAEGMVRMLIEIMEVQ